MMCRGAPRGAQLGVLRGILPGVMLVILPSNVTAKRKNYMQSSVPLDFLGDLKRTHSCGQLRPSYAGARALLMGWVHRRRDLGGVIFIHLRDRDGVTEAVFHTDTRAT